MKLLVFGSANVDHVYQMDRFVRAGETIASRHYQKNAGGKGLNQAITLAKAGQEVYFAGAIGRDGLFLKDMLEDAGVRTDYLRVLDAPTGHAVIQVDASGQNSIILYGGTNQQIDQEMIDETLMHFGAGDHLLLQNEINLCPALIEAAWRKGINVILNPSPTTQEMRVWPLKHVKWFILNEIEGADLTGKTAVADIADELIRRYPNSRVVLTCAEAGALYADAEQRICQKAFRVDAVDTTGAGDTFTGYFLRCILNGGTPARALLEAAQASAIAVTREGAGKSVPRLCEVMETLRAMHSR